MRLLVQLLAIRERISLVMRGGLVQLLAIRERICAVMRGGLVQLVGRKSVQLLVREWLAGFIGNLGGCYYYGMLWLDRL